jgi:GNAT superfamily N-acetyltransferase
MADAPRPQTVTDMIIGTRDLRIPPGQPEVTLVAQLPSTRAAVLALVERHHPGFTEYFRTPPAGTTICQVVLDGDVVGAVHVEVAPRSAESAADGALGCLVVVEEARGRGVGSAAIAACVAELGRAGFDRVIAEWVASVPLYERLGFTVWRTREVEA